MTSTEFIGAPAEKRHPKPNSTLNLQSSWKKPPGLWTETMEKRLRSDSDPPTPPSFSTSLARFVFGGR